MKTRLPILGMGLLALVMAYVMLSASGQSSSYVENKITLTDAVKARLISAKSLRGNGVNNTSFDGKPLLVTFFASW